MRRSALAMVSWLCAASALAFAACGDNDPTLDDGVAGVAGEAAGGANQGTGGARGGSSSGRGGNGGGDGGARGGNGGEPANGGGGGTTSTGGSSIATGGHGGETGGVGGDGGAGTAGAGGEAGDEPPLPPICNRIVVLQRQLRADRVAQGTDRAIFGDCRLSWFRSLYVPGELDTYLNEVSRLTMVFWGCRDEEPAGFKLAYGTVSLSSEEVDALVIHYLAAMRIEIDISDAEERRLRSELERLAEPRIDPNIHGFARSTCDGGEGGATGAGSMAEGG
jgi:hypothetical protein